ncbi:MAG: phosphate ABC transporter permease, partial [Gammaproteobacteria bacterium]
MSSVSSADSENTPPGPDSRFRLESMDLGLRRKIRHLTDRTARTAIAIGGIAVIVTILLIFLYLIYEIVPLFRTAQVELAAEYSLPQASASTLHLAIEEQSEIGLRLGDDGMLVFFRVADAAEILSQPIIMPTGTSIASFGLESEESGIFALGLDNGDVVMAQYEFETRFEPPDNRRVIVPSVSYPYGQEPITLFADQPVGAVAIRTRGDSMLLTGVAADGSLALVRGEQQTGLFSAFDFADSGSMDLQFIEVDLLAPNTRQLFFEGDARWLYLLSSGGLLRMLDIQAAQRGALSDFSFETYLNENRQQPSQVAMLLGGISLLATDSSGETGQWVITRSEEGSDLARIRSFPGNEESITALTTEQRRKNFITGDASGRVSFYNTTASRTAFSEQLIDDEVSQLAVSPRGDALLIESASGELSLWHVENEHPEVSWAALWNQVWYEGYSEPEYIWQSSGATNEFEPKYSLMPLSFGTLKAAFYAMLLAAPLAICGAIFTGYFMAPVMRRNVK